MNKTDLINEVSGVVASKTEAKAAVDCIFSAITDALKGGDGVSLTGFGTFRADQRKARTAKNPRTGEPIEIPARKVPRFVPGKALKEAVE